MKAHAPIAFVANTRLPSQRAQALQVVQMSAAFARAGAATTLYHAQRRTNPALPAGADLWSYYGVPPGAHPALESVPCVDWIDRVPRVLQYVPARLQEQTFARNTARLLAGSGAATRVYSREIETARDLTRSGHARVFLEIHRVPGGRLRRRWLLEAARKSRGLVAISHGIAEDLEALGVPHASITVEHDAFEPARFAGLPDKSVARRALDLPLDAPIVVYTGGLLQWKGVDLLVDAARGLPSAYVVIAGGLDADVRALRARAAGLANVRIDGFQSPERVALYLAAGDVGVVPNRSEPAISARYTSPLKVFEAMAVGLALVASDLPSLREILTHDRDAWLVRADDANALRLGLEQVLSDEPRRLRLGSALGARASEHTWDARAARLLAWMER